MSIRPDDVQSRGSRGPQNAQATGTRGTNGSSPEFRQQAEPAEKVAAQQRNANTTTLSQIYSEATDGDEAQQASQDGSLSKKRKKTGSEAGTGRTNNARSANVHAIDPNAEQDHASDEKRTVTKTSASKKYGRTEVADMSDKQEDLAGRLVQQPQTYHGLSAANTEASYGRVDGLRELIVRNPLWQITAKPEAATMQDQIYQTELRKSQA